MDLHQVTTKTGFRRQAAGVRLEASVHRSGKRGVRIWSRKLKQQTWI